MFRISELYVYPIKSLGGISLQQATLSETGFTYDRNWMLVDVEGSCVTQREYNQLACFKLAFVEGGIQVNYRDEHLVISTAETTSEFMTCTIWEDTLMARKEPNHVSDWFSKHLGNPVFLVSMAPNNARYVKRHAPHTVHFPDSAPFLVLGEASLHHLNEKLDQEVSMDRFRPNIVFKGGAAHDEDTWHQFRIGSSHFESTKLCARCTMTTIDQKTGDKGEEPLLTLSKYRNIDRKIMFGHYFTSHTKKDAAIAVGDSIEVIAYRAVR